MDDHNVFLRPPAWLPVVVALLLGGGYILGKYVETRHMDATVISVSGEGTVYAVPDIALLTFGVQTGRQRTAQAAMENLSKRMTAVIDAVEAVGIEERDIRTQGLWLSPSYDFRDGRRTDQGFEANQQLTVKVRDLDKITAVLDAAVTKGANDVGGVSFTMDDPDALRAQARAEAIEEAEEKAEVLADDLGVRLGKLKGFSEDGFGVPPPIMMRAMEVGVGGAMDKAMAPPVPAGEREIRVTVSLTYEIY